MFILFCERRGKLSKVEGYAGKILRVDLTKQQISEEVFSKEIMRKFIGGTGLGIKILYDEITPDIEWSDPDNRLFIGQGPLGGSPIGGSGSISVVTKGAMTNGATSTQANGYFGAYMKLNGIDGIIVQGASDKLQYLKIEEGTTELENASWLSQRNTYDTTDLLKHELDKKEREASVLSIGPAGENQVRFAGIFVDYGHSASHNGVGAVLGSKKLKAIIASRRKGELEFADRKQLTAISRKFLENMKSQAARLYNWGTLTGIKRGAGRGTIPIKNYTTNIWDIDDERLDKFDGPYLREKFSVRRNSCWGCSAHHCDIFKITEGPYQGVIVEEPEYEQFSALGPAIDNKDTSKTLMLSKDVDALGVDTNETGWLLGFVMECYEKGVLSKEELNGIEMNWGNAESARRLLHLIAHREGVGDLLAEGVKRAAARIGGEAPQFAIHTLKGNTPRGHDHRTRWNELFDTCVSGTSTIETNAPVSLTDFSREMALEVSTSNAKTKGMMQLDDSAVTCRFNTRMNVQLVSEAIAAATGWDFTYEEGMQVGKRAVNLLRAFNIRHGISSELDYPSPRYGSTPINGPAKDTSILAYWSDMLSNYYELMGWDVETGRPLPQTLRMLGLEYIIADIW
jgi:aldehyde:ferredoxin oxidoreductase